MILKRLIGTLANVSPNRITSCLGASLIQYKTDYEKTNYDARPV